MSRVPSGNLPAHPCAGRRGCRSIRSAPARRAILGSSNAIARVGARDVRQSKKPRHGLIGHRHLRPWQPFCPGKCGGSGRYRVGPSHTSDRRCCACRSPPHSSRGAVGNDRHASANGFATACARNTLRRGVRAVTSRYDHASETVRSVTTQHTEFWLDRSLKVAARVRIPLGLPDTRRVSLLLKSHPRAALPFVQRVTMGRFGRRCHILDAAISW
jgi:hypothetical protein